MLPTFVHQQCLARAFSTLRSRSRYIHSLSHLTSAEKQIFMRHSFEKAPVKRNPVPQPAVEPEFIRPQIYCSASSSWIGLENGVREVLGRDRILKVMTWNIDHSSPGQEARAVAALKHLRALLEKAGDSHVIMLQEVCRESLQEILNCSWVQQNFALSNVAPPESLYTDIAGESFILKKLRWSAAPFFTLMMVSRDIPITGCFRVPFMSIMGRDALVIDIPVSLDGDCSEEERCLHLCTTHLESLDAQPFRAGQLGLISKLLKGTPHTASRVIGGLVGGDMNAFDQSEHEIHKTIDVDLNDVWEDVPAPPVPTLKPFRKDLSYGQARGNTWGYQSNRGRTRKRLDKFLYTGSIEMVAPNEGQDVTGKLGRFGINLKTEVDAWEREYKTLSRVPGGYVMKTGKEYYSKSFVAKWGKGDLIPKKMDFPVSDHFGLVVGIRVVCARQEGK